MKTIKICATSVRMLLVAAAFAFGLVLWPAAIAAQGTPSQVTSTPGQMTSSTSVTGSGARYTTTVEARDNSQAA